MVGDQVRHGGPAGAESVLDPAQLGQAEQVVQHLLAPHLLKHNVNYVDIEVVALNVGG